MKIIDAHTHVFEVLKGYGPKGEMRAIGDGKARWSNGDIVGMVPPGYGDKNFTGESLIRLMDEHRIEKAVLLQGSFYGFQNEYTAEVVNQYPSRLIGAGTLDPFSKNAAEIYARLSSEFGFRIIKFEVSSGGGLMGYHRRFAVEDVLDIYAGESAKRGHTFVIDIGSPGMESFQPKGIRALALKYPKLKIVVCHLLAPRAADESVLTESLKLLNLPNVWFDLAAVPFNLMPERRPFPTAGRFILAAVDIVGHEKLLWGSDIPSVMIHESYGDLINYLREIPGLSREVLEDIYYHNAIAAYPFI